MVVLPSILGVFQEAPPRRLPHAWRKHYRTVSRNLANAMNSQFPYGLGGIGVRRQVLSITGNTWPMRRREEHQ